MRALVTGHAGFVGRHMTKALFERGYDVLGIDLAFADGSRSLAGDCREFFRTHEHPRVDLVVHCAAVVGGRTMIDGAPLQLAAEDLSIDAELFRWALRTRPKRIVYFSSSAAYPVELQQMHTAERLRESDIGGNHLGMPDATYGWVKLTGERLAAEANAEGIPTFVFRPFSGYGADQDLAYPFPAIVRRAATHDPAVPFEVWGHPASTRDWVHIDDVVRCVFAHLDADVRGPVNICTGRATSFAELAHMALARFGIDGVPIQGDTSKPMGVFHRVGDPARMADVYMPQITVEGGLDRAVAAWKAAA